MGGGAGRKDHLAIRIRSAWRSKEKTDFLCQALSMTDRDMKWAGGEIQRTVEAQLGNEGNPVEVTKRPDENE